jgi:TPR repeat protein
MLSIWSREGADLHLDEFQRDLAGIGEAVHRADRHIGRFVLVVEAHLLADRDLGDAAHHFGPIALLTSAVPLSLRRAGILFLRAANTGDATAAVAMGTTYDPIVLADRGVLGVAADLVMARSWYERAKEMGSPEGLHRLEMLANR